MNNEILSIFDDIKSILFNIDALKKKAIEIGKMDEYKLCNQIRIDFNKFYNQILNQISYLLSGREVDFDFLFEQKILIEKKLLHLPNLEDFATIESTNIYLQQIQGSTSNLLASIKDCKDIDSTMMIDKINIFRYSTFY